jgi:DUF1680 family protein
MMKLTRAIYALNADPRCFDHYERLLFNHRLGTIRPELGHTQYYQSLTPGAWRTFCSEEESFWCCTGTGVEEFSKLADSIYWHDDTSLYVNLFIPSRLTWEAKGVVVQQETRFPDEERTLLKVIVNRPTPLTIRLRIPGWVAGSASVQLNGRLLETGASPGSYLTLTRTWRNGDTVELGLPMALLAQGLPDDPGLQAFLYGPVLLGGELGTEGLSPELVTGSYGPRLAAPNPSRPWPANEPPAVRDVAVPAFTADGEPGNFLHRAGEGLEFESRGQKADVTLKPFHRIKDARYCVYWRVTGA